MSEHDDTPPAESLIYQLESIAERLRCLGNLTNDAVVHAHGVARELERLVEQLKSQGH